MDDEGTRLGQEAAVRLRDFESGFDLGLSEAEFTRIEGRFGFEFADDHRAFLAAGLPAGPSWPDWRDGAEEGLLRSLAWPVDGALFDIEENALWFEDWGKRPTDAVDALAVAREKLAEVPHMVPVYSHRYLPAGRGTFGHPVLSIYQTDIICYGFTLVDYFTNEFGQLYERHNRRWARAFGLQPIVDFWSDLVS